MKPSRAVRLYLLHNLGNGQRWRQFDEHMRMVGHTANLDCNRSDVLNDSVHVCPEPWQEFLWDLRLPIRDGKDDVDPHNDVRVSHIGTGCYYMLPGTYVPG